MSTQPSSPPRPSDNNSNGSFLLFSQKVINDLFDTDLKPSVDLKSNLPVRRNVLSYLTRLDRRWRGGWSWQWPIVIAGPVEGGKTQLAYQFIASSLLSFPSPWRISYSDLAGDYRPERIQKILGWRKQGSPEQWQLGRIDKHTVHSRADFYNLLRWNTNRPDLALWVIDAFEHVENDDRLPIILQILAELGRRRNMGIIVTIRGMIDTLRPLIPWSYFPFFLYITQKRHRVFHLRVWQKGVPENVNISNQANQITKIYDWILDFYGYFQEVDWSDRQQRIKKRVQQ